MTEHEASIAEECGKFVIKSNKFQKVILIDLISLVNSGDDFIELLFLKKSGIDTHLVLKKDDFEDPTWLHLQDFFINTYSQIPAPGISMEGD